MDLLQLDNFKLNRVVEEDHDFHIYATLADETTNCQHCGKYGVVGFGRREQIIKDLPRLGKRSSIYVETRRWRCKNCGKTFYEDLPEVDVKRRMTDRLVQWIGEQAVRRTYASVAEEVGVTEGTIRLVFTEYVQAKYEKMNFATPRWLGIDEIYLIKPRCVLTNVEKLTAFDILNNRNKVTVTDRLWRLPDRRSVDLVTIDMWRPYRDAAQIALPNATVVVDKFHVVRLLNAASDTVRKTLRSSLTKQQRRGLVKDRFLMLKRQNRLSGQEQMMLSGWLENYPELAMAYEVKEAGYRIYDARTREEAQEAFTAWKASVPQEMKGAFGDFQRAFENWQTEILNYFDYRVTNAYTESLNNLIRTTNRVGRGYSFEALRAKVLLSEGPEKVQLARPKFQKRLSDNLEISRHEMRLPDRMPQNFGTPLSTLPQILGDDENGSDQS
ncbi:MAG: ISL3 family transposase [Nereida ignava]